MLAEHPVQLVKLVEEPYAICMLFVPRSIGQLILSVTPVVLLAIALLLMVNHQLYGA